MKIKKREWRSFVKIKNREKVVDFLEKNLFLKGSPLGTRFKSSMTPWVCEPLEEFANNHNREITCQCCVQGGKTTVLHGAAVWAIVNDCAAMYITCQTDEDARDFARERLNPSLDALGVNIIELPTDRSKRSVAYVSLPNGFVLAQGANTNNLQSKSVRWILNDEVYLWKTGLLDEARKRGTRFWNRRILNCSTAGSVGDDIDRAYKAGSQKVWHLLCPSCKTLTRPSWERIRWDKDRSTVDGVLNLNLLSDSARYECEHCKTLHRHTQAIHRIMNDGGRYVADNLNPSPQCVSFSWNSICLAPTEVSWGELAVEWCLANDEWGKGNELPRKEFIQKRLGESWSNDINFADLVLPVIPLSDWGDEIHRFMTVDVQEGHFWVMVQGWNAAGDDFVYFADKLLTWEDLRAKQNEYQIKATCVFIDSGYDSRRVYGACVDYGWIALKGEDVSTIYISAKGQRRQSFYSWPPSQGDAMLGAKEGGGARYCPVIRWAKRGVLDIAGLRRDGRAKGIKCLVGEGVSEHFQKQMFSEKPKIERDKRGREFRRWHRIGHRPNHLWDCYCMGIVAACMVGVIGKSV